MSELEAYFMMQQEDAEKPAEKPQQSPESMLAMLKAHTPKNARR